jgi:hypothetical protein
MFNKALFIMILGLSNNLFATQIDVQGNVQSKCVVTQDTMGRFGNPIPSKLSTDATDGGVDPVVRFDVITANTYKARIEAPNLFSESPTLNDTLAWTGVVSVDQVSDASMSAYDTSKITFENVTEVDLTVTGSTWFKIESEANYGYSKALPAGTYRAVVVAECIAL